MRTILAITILAVSLGGLALWSSLRAPDSFGVFRGAELVDVATLLDRPRDFLKRPVAVQGTIAQQCKAMGCYFVIPAGNRSLRVNLEDIAMKAPNHEGGRVRLEGQLVPYGDSFQLFATAVDFR